MPVPKLSVIQAAEQHLGPIFLTTHLAVHCARSQKTTQQPLEPCTTGIVTVTYAGVFMPQTQNQDALYFQNRQGYVRLAIQAGKDILPVYNFGQSQVGSTNRWTMAFQAMIGF